MHDRRFDALARALAKPGSRRRYLLGALGLGAVGAAATRGGGMAQVLACRQEGQGCTMLTGCCAGLTCVTKAMNPNTGICETGGTAPVEIQQPFGDGAPAATATPKPTKTPKPTRVPRKERRDARRPDFRVDIQAVCYDYDRATLEPRVEVSVANLGDKRVTISQIESVNTPDVLIVNELLLPNERIRFVQQESQREGNERVSNRYIECGFFAPPDPSQRRGVDTVRVVFRDAAGDRQVLSQRCEGYPSDRPPSCPAGGGSAVGQETRIEPAEANARDRGNRSARKRRRRRSLEPG